MTNYEQLKADIAAVVRANGIEAITGDRLQQVLTHMVDVLGNDYALAGVATPTTNPPTPDGNTAYIAGTSGTYTYFLDGNYNPLIVPSICLTALLMYDASAEAWTAYPFGTIAQGSIGTNELADGAVTTPKLADSAVTSAKIGANAVTSAKINNGAVSEQKLATALQNKINDAVTLSTGQTITGDKEFTQPIQALELYGDGDLSVHASDDLTLQSHNGDVEIAADDDINLNGARVFVNTELNVDAGLEVGTDTGGVNSIKATGKILTNGQEVATKAYTDAQLATKQDTIGDLNTIRAGASLGATALQEIPDGSVTTPKIADEAVTTPKIDDEAVTLAKIAPSAIDATPTANSGNLVTSGGVRDKIDDLAEQVGVSGQVTETLTPTLTSGYINNGTINSSAIYGYTPPIYLKKGAKIIVNTYGTSFDVVSLTNEQATTYSRLVAASASPTTTKEYQYTALSDCYVAISVKTSYPYSIVRQYERGLSDLQTTNKDNIIDAINEVYSDSVENGENIGNLSQLRTIEKSNVVGSINEIDTKLYGSTVDYSSRNKTASSYWLEGGDGKITYASSGMGLRRVDAISVRAGDIVVFSASVSPAAANIYLVTDSDGNVISKLYDSSVADYSVVMPVNAANLYFNSMTNTTFSCVIQHCGDVAELKTEVSTLKTKTNDLSWFFDLRKPIHAPSPQLPANGSADADFDAETLTPNDLYTAFSDLIASLPTRGAYRGYFPKTLTEYSKTGRDATNTYDIKAYVYTNRNRFAWKSADKLFAFNNGGTIVYLDTCSPLVGATIYSNASRSDSGKVVSSYNSTTQSFVSSDSVTYERKESSDVASVVVWSKVVMDINATSTLTVFNANDQAIGVTTTVDATHITRNSVVYERCEDFDYWRGQLGTIVLWGNEHGPSSDPAEPAIILYRLAKDLTTGCRNNEFVEFLKTYFRIVFIPLVNPYGLVHKSRNNGNNVNINRNYNTIGWANQADADKGSYAGDQPETQFVMNVVKAYDTTLAIDVHCLGFVNNLNEGMCHYEGYVGDSDALGVATDTMQSFNLNHTSYGNAEPNNAAKGSDWIYANGIAGGLEEMNAGAYASSYDGKQHNAYIMECDYTLLLNHIRMWLYDTNLGLNLLKYQNR